MDHGLSVRRFVFAAAGSVDDCVLKYAPKGHPSQQALRYWQRVRPVSSRVRFAVRPGMMRRLASNNLPRRVATLSSPQLSGIAGWNLPSGSWGRFSIEPEI